MRGLTASLKTNPRKAAVVLVALWVLGPGSPSVQAKCRKFVRYTGTSISVGAFESEVGKAVLKLGKLEVTPIRLQPSESLQERDFDQYEICQLIASMEPGPVKEAATLQRLEIL